MFAAAAEPNMFASAGTGYIDAIIQGEPVEAVTIDLKTAKGEGYLSSRLFLAAALMVKQRNLKVVAFVHASRLRTGVYLGACLAEDLLRAISVAFPEYEAALALAIHQQWWISTAPQPSMAIGAAVVGDPLVEPVRAPLITGGRFPAPVAGRVVGAFLELVQARNPPPEPTQLAPGWVRLQSSQVAERADWVDAEWLRHALGSALTEERVVKGPRAAEQVVAAKGPYVGVVDDANELVEIVSRCRVVEHIAMARAVTGPDRT